MRLKKISYRNFKGQSKTIDCSKDLIISGRNGAGKTTVIDAITWILFDKFSDGSQTLPKPLDDNNEVIKAEVEVELVTNLGTYRKTLNEKFKTVSGVTSLSGHSYEYYLDDIPVKKMEYDNKIKESFTEKEFFIGALPTTFLSEQIHWKERRAILQQLVETPSDEEILEKEPMLSEVLVEGWTTEDYEDEKRRIKVNKDKATARYNLIEPLIEENRKSFTSTTEADIKKKSEALAELEKERQELVNQQDLSLDKAILEAKNTIKKLELEYLDELSKMEQAFSKGKIELDNRYSSELQEARKQVASEETKLNEAKLKRQKLSDVLVEIKSRRMALETDIKVGEASLNTLKDKYLTLNNSMSELAMTKAGICPTCGQTMPVDNDKIEEKKASILASQEEITTQVNALNASKADALKNIEDTEKEIGHTEGLINEVLEEIKKLETDLDNKLAGLTLNIEETYQNRMSQLKTHKDEERAKIGSFEEKTLPYEQKITELEKQKADAIPDTTEIDLKIKDMKNEIAKAKADIELNTISQRRIKELEAERGILAKEIEALGRKLYLIDLRSKLWAESLNSKVSSLFKVARFKLFDYIMSTGELKETCDVLYEGRATMSGGEQIYVGIDIANTLTEHWGVSIPLLVDNLQDLTKQIETDRQFIGLKTEEIDFTIKEMI